MKNLFLIFAFLLIGVESMGQVTVLPHNDTVWSYRGQNSVKVFELQLDSSFEIHNLELEFRGGFNIGMVYVSSDGNMLGTVVIVNRIAIFRGIINNKKLMISVDVNSSCIEGFREIVTIKKIYGARNNDNRYFEQKNLDSVVLAYKHPYYKVVNPIVVPVNGIARCSLETHGIASVRILHASQNAITISFKDTLVFEVNLIDKFKFTIDSMEIISSSGLVEKVIGPFTWTIDHTTSLDTKVQESTIVYPNPTTDWIHIDGYDGFIKVFDLHGRELLQTTEKIISLRELPVGVYTITAGKYSKRVIKLGKGVMNAPGYRECFFNLVSKTFFII